MSSVDCRLNGPPGGGGGGDLVWPAGTAGAAPGIGGGGRLLRLLGAGGAIAMGGDDEVSSPEIGTMGGGRAEIGDIGAAGGDLAAGPETSDLVAS